MSSPTVSRSAASGAGAAPARPRAWASLPPIQRTAGAMPMVAAPGEFVDALPGTQGLPPVVQQLGHEVSPMATPGLVVARVRAVEQASGSIPAPVQRRARRSVQRQADGAAADSIDTWEPDPIVTSVAAPVPSSPSVSRSVSASSTGSAAPVVARSAAPDGAGADAGDDDDLTAAGIPAPDLAPVRSLPTVSRSAIRVPDRPLTSAASVVRTVAQRSHAGHAHPSPASDGAAAAAPLPAPSGGMRRAPSNPALARSAMPTVSRQAGAPITAASQASPGAPASPASPSVPAASASTPSLPSLAPTSSRRGIGEPTSLPATARPVGATPSPVVSRSTMAGAMPLASSGLRTTIQRTADGGDENEDGEDAPVQRSMASSARPGMPSLPSLPVLTVSRSAWDGGAGPSAASTASAPAHKAIASSSAGSSASASPLPSTAGGGSTATPIQRSTAPAIRPIAAHNPLRPSIALQREADDQPVGGDDEDGGLPSPWWVPASEGTSAGASTSALTRTGEVPAAAGSAAVQRTASVTSSPVSTAAALIAAAQAPGSRSTVHGVQRSTRAAASSGTPPKLPLAVPHAEGTRQQTAASAPATAAGPSITFPGVGIVAGPSVQTSRAGSPAPALPSHGESHVVQRVESSSSAAANVVGPASQPGQSERDLDELAKALFGRIRTRLRNDLLNDREAAGLTFDIV